MRCLAPLALAALAAGCGGAPQGGAAWPPVGSGADAKAMIEVVAEAARAAAGHILSDGQVNGIGVAGELGTATVTGEVFHTTTPDFDGTNAVPTLDVDVTVVFDRYRTLLESGLRVTLTGTVDLLDTFPSPGSAIDPLSILPQPIEVSGDVAAVYEGSDAAGAYGQADTFAFAAQGQARDKLKGSLTNRAGTKFTFTF